MPETAVESVEAGTVQRRVSTGVDRSANLDFLRSFAVCCVLLAHLATALRIDAFYYVGRAGVLMFFVHTALVLLQSMRRLHSDGMGRVSHRFLLQRCFRVYPLYVAAIGFSLLLRVPAAQTFQQHASASWLGWKWLAANLLFSQNIVFVYPVSGPMWSLPYEMQMYLALPLVYLTLQQTEPVLKLLLVALFAAFASAVMIAWHPDPMYAPVTHYVPCFLGGAYAFAHSRKPRRVPFWLLPVSLIGMAAIHSFTRTSLIEWPLCTALGFLLPRVVELNNELLSAICHSIAQYSYGLYLWHWPLLWLWFRKIDGLPVAMEWLLFLASLAATTMASYHWIEAPMIRYGRRLTLRSVPPASALADNTMMLAAAAGR